MVLEEGKRAIKLSGLYESYGYVRFKMSKFEEYDTYVKNKSFLTSDNIITFTDTNGKLMALKPDVTLSIVKNSKEEENQAQKVYYNENVYRVSGDSHAFKEIMQSGLECIGDVGEYEISEVISIALESLKLLAPAYVLDVSHIGIIAAAVDALGVSSDAKKSLLGFFGSKNICGAEEAMEKEGVAEEKRDIIRKLMSCCGSPEEVLPMLESLPLGEIEQPVSQLKKILSVIEDKNIRIDFSVINDMRYYNGIVFQGFVRSVPKCVLSGGQYDALMKKMRRLSRAIGFAIYLDELKEEEERGLDVDTLVIFKDTTPPATVYETVKKEREKGKRVMAQKAIPTGKTYGKIINL